MSNLREKTSPRLAISYGMGEVACQMSWYMVNSYLMLFYTDVVGLTGGVISIIMLIARVWDAVNDPMMGTLADRTNTRWGKFRPYLFAAPPFLAIFNILTFTVFPLEGTAKAVICLLTYVGTGMAYTACSIAYQALQHVVAVDSRVRMNLATARGIGGAVVGIILSATVMPAILFFSHSETQANAAGYFWVTVILSVAMVPVFWLTALGCKETYTEKLHAEHKEKMGLIKSLREVVKNDQLLMVVLSTVLGAMCVSGRMGVLSYYVIYVVGGYEVIATVFTTMSVAQLIGTLLIPFGVRLFGKKRYMIFLQVLMCVTFLLLFINPNCSMAYLLVVSFVCGICNSAAAICPGMISDSIEYGDWKLGRRQEGVAASFLSFGVKIATAISGSVGILLLEAAGYVAKQEQTASAKMGINAVVNLVPFVLGLISLIPLIFYKLNDKRVAEIRADLEAGKHAGN